jgi:uncharacterized membrane protein YbaN (DUF454 family)
MSRLRAIYAELKGNLTSTRRIIAIVFASIMAVIGFATMLIPLFPSRLFLTPALLIFSVYSPTAYKWLKQKTQKYPRLQSITDRTRNTVINTIHPTPKLEDADR